MADFTAAIESILRHEGGYVHDPRDSGGETNWGISRASYPNVDIKALTKDGARDIYRRDFWTPLHLDELDSELLASQILDHSVNAGKRMGVHLAQKALNYFHPGRLEEDGVMGVKTIAELNGFKGRGLLVQVYQALRVAHYVSIVRTTSSRSVFAAGWARRVYEG